MSGMSARSTLAAVVFPAVLWLAPAAQAAPSEVKGIHLRGLCNACSTTPRSRT